jgi:hypothetical protein
VYRDSIVPIPDWRDQSIAAFVRCLDRYTRDKPLLCIVERLDSLENGLRADFLDYVVSPIRIGMVPRARVVFSSLEAIPGIAEETVSLAYPDVSTNDAWETFEDHLAIRFEGAELEDAVKAARIFFDSHYRTGPQTYRLGKLPKFLAHITVVLQGI